METLKNISNTASAYAQTALTNPYVMAVVKITIVLYAAQMAPRLPSPVSVLFSNTFFKLFALFLIAYLAEHDIQLSIILAVVFVFGTNLLSGRGLFESFADFSADYKSDPNFKLIEPKSILYPGCQNITVNDLMSAFDNDKLKLQSTVQNAFKELLLQISDKPTKEKLMYISHATGVPYNVPLNDENAPLYATILLYSGFQFGDKCIAPQQ
jgi:hypothetical protein